MHYETPPFELGSTLKGTDDDGNLINGDKLGKVYFLPSTKFTSGRGVNDRRTGKGVYAVALRNESGGTLYGKRLGQLVRTAGYGNVQAVDGYCAVLAEKRFVVIDEYLATNGVADDDIFWGVISGPVTILTPAAGAAFNGDIAVAAPLVAATAATTGATTSGRVSNVTLPGQTGATVAFQMAANLVGYALSARTTGETHADILVDACIRW